MKIISQFSRLRRLAYIYAIGAFALWQPLIYAGVPRSAGRAISLRQR